MEDSRDEISTDIQTQVSDIQEVINPKNKYSDKIETVYKYQGLEIQ